MARKKDVHLICRNGIEEISNKYENISNNAKKAVSKPMRKNADDDNELNEYLGQVF